MAEATHQRVPGDFGHGPLGRLTGAVYWFVVVAVLLLVAALPTAVLLLLLDRSPGNAPFLVLAAVPLGPALSAALYAVRDRSRSESLTPARSFWKGYRLNGLDVLRVWVPALLVLGIEGWVLANAGAAGLTPAYVVVLAVLAVVVLLWALHAVAIASFFSFRARDVARLAAYYVLRLPLVTIGLLSLLIFAAGVTWVASDVGLVALGSVWVWLWYRNDRPMLDDVRRRFTTP
ncbi:DUF624 domain-containing protein [Puerhibacterium puerhi]|uniref:DUF624 domain-containing protein n=1 Tax=Puerhibacterium puerhi TaxID=2692623 RepID=UPI001356B12D|nr:DUF624 domain-containing protein [Puerhibacterium puerhi]